MSLTKDKKSFILGIVLLLGYVGVAWWQLDHHAWSYDEGVLLQTAVLTHNNHPLYSETVFNKPPLFVWWIEAAYRLLGVGLWQARTAVLLLTAAGLWLLGSVARAWWGAWAGVAAMAAYLLIPETLVRAAVVMNDLPALMLMIAALFAATRYQQTTRWGWAAGAGLLYALGVAVHPLLLFMVVPIALLLAWQPSIGWAWRHLLRSGLLAGGTAVLVTLGWLLLVDWAGFWQWVVAYNRAPVDPLIQARIDNNLSELLAYQLAHWHLVLAGLLGGGLLLRYAPKPQRHFLWVTAVYYLLILWTLASLQPMWSHYPIFSLIPPLLLFAGGMAQTWRPNTPVPLPLRGLLWASTAALLLFGTFAERDWPTAPDGFEQAAGHLREVVPAKTFVISDDPYLLFVSDLWLLPPLADGSQKRISAKLLHPATVLQAGWGYETTHFATAFRRFGLVPQLQPWLLDNGANSQSFGDFVVGEFPPLPVMETPVFATFGDDIMLEGITVEVQQAGEMRVVEGVLFWKTAVSLPTDYKRFIHLLDDAGNLVAQTDSHPANNLLFTTHWVPNQPLADPFRIVLPPDAPSGTLAVGVGLYTEADLLRLPARDGAGEPVLNDVLVVGEVELR